MSGAPINVATRVFAIQVILEEVARMSMRPRPSLYNAKLSMETMSFLDVQGSCRRVAHIRGMVSSGCTMGPTTA